MYTLIHITMKEVKNSCYIKIITYRKLDSFGKETVGNNTKEEGTWIFLCFFFCG